jgi:hypothetical protein
MVAIVAGAGYLVLAHLEGRGREQAWAATALAVATLGIVLEHALVTVDGASPWPLAAAYAAAGAGLATVYARWRWLKPSALLPRRGDGGLGNVVGGSGMPDEWRPLGTVARRRHLLLAHSRARERTCPRPWRCRPGHRRHHRSSSSKTRPLAACDRLQCRRP